MAESAMAATGAKTAPSAPVVRDATVDDAVGIATSHIRSWQAGYRHVIPTDFLDGLDTDLGARTLRWQAQILGAAAASSFVLVAEVDGEVAGWLAGGPARDLDEPDDRLGEVHGCYVDPAHWRTGVGSALMGEAVDRLRRTGYEEAVLWVLDDNPRARAFYERHGWSPDGGRSTFEIAAMAIPEVRYRRRLDALS